MPNITVDIEAKFHAAVRSVEHAVHTLDVLADDLELAGEEQGAAHATKLATQLSALVALEFFGYEAESACSDAKDFHSLVKLFCDGGSWK